MRPLGKNSRTLYEILNTPMDNVALGETYARFVYDAPVSYSPGIMLRSHPGLNVHAVQEFQRNFQLRARRYISTEREGSVSPDVLQKRYASLTDKFDYRTVEGMVAVLAKEGRFEDIGAAVKKGAEQFQKRMIDRGMRNYQVSAEYRAIARALQKILEEDKK